MFQPVTLHRSFQGDKVIASPVEQAVPADDPSAPLLALILTSLDDGKAEELVSIDLRGKSSLADYMVIASGRSSRQVTALADQIATKLKDGGFGSVSIEGKAQGDWVLLDAGDVIVHLFRPEVRLYYNLEKMWGSLSLQQDGESA